MLCSEMLHCGSICKRVGISSLVRYGVFPTNILTITGYCLVLLLTAHNAVLFLERAGVDCFHAYRSLQREPNGLCRRQIGAVLFNAPKR